MRSGPIVAIASVIALVTLPFAPATAVANQFHVRGGNGAHFHGPIVGHRGFVHPFFPRTFVRPVIPFGVFAAPIIVAAPPPVYYSPPTYYDSSAYAYPQTGYAGRPPNTSLAVASAPPPPPPSVVQYDHGRYELRGDGITTPYTWVWIPNPPPPPPPPAPPETTPPGPPVPTTPSKGRHTQVYRWTDEQGVVHWTDDPSTVPRQHRGPATRI
jgi:Domain of unknown function (DUF4124)